MLILRRFKLAYACQHEALEHHLGPGIIAIRGQNGSGKSNLVELIRASVTNDFSGMEGNKLDNICRNLPSGAPSYVETEWEVSAGIVVLRRALANATTELRLNNVVIANKESAVTEQVFKLMDIQPKVFKDFLFADYIKLIQLAAGNKESRSELIQSLCGLEILDKLDRQLRDAVSADGALVAQYDPAELDLELRTWSEYRLAIREGRSKVEELGRHILDGDTQKQYRQRLAKRESYEMYRAELAKAEDRLRKAKADEESVGSELELTEKSCLTQGTAVLATEKQLLEQERLHRAYVASQAYQNKAKQLQVRIDQPAPVAAAAPEGLAMDATTASSTLAVMMERIRETEDALQLVDDGQEITCPTCLRLLKPSTAYLEFLQQRLSEAKQQLQVAKDCGKQWRAFELASQKYKTDKSIWDRTVADAKHDLSQLEKPSEEGQQDAGQISLLRSQLQESKAKLAEVNKAKVDTMMKQASSQTRIESATADIASYSEEIAKLGKPETVQTLKKLKDLLDAHELCIDDYNAKQSKLNVLLIRAGETSKRIRKLRAQRRSLRRLSKWVDTLKRARDVFKRDRLPARVVAGMLHRTTAKLNEYLGQLSVPFSVVADPAEFSFLATHNDGTVERAKRLSTGQSLCLGISFWLARADVFSGQLPFFCFDEPTSNLDDEHVVSVAELFSYLANDLVRKHRQGLVITHHEALARCATQVIQL